jgi:membrane-associated phospholipid phosphatase
MAGRLKLPIFMSLETKYSFGSAMFAFAAAFYLITNHFHLSPPRELPLTWIDQATPFMPITLWIYLSDYVFFGAAYIAARDALNLNKYVYAFIALQIVSCLIFWFWPTTYPRGMFPIPESTDAITHYVFESFRQTDTPANCCPSLHVSCAYLTAFIFLHERRKLFVPFLAWATAIAISTLTTKQHYLADVVSGFGLALILYWVFFRWASYAPRERMSAAGSAAQSPQSLAAESGAGAQANR